MKERLWIIIYTATLKTKIPSKIERFETFYFKINFLPRLFNILQLLKKKVLFCLIEEKGRKAFPAKMRRGLCVK